MMNKRLQMRNFRLANYQLPHRRYCAQKIPDDLETVAAAAADDGDEDRVAEDVTAPGDDLKDFLQNRFAVNRPFEFPYRRIADDANRPNSIVGYKWVADAAGDAHEEELGSLVAAAAAVDESGPDDAETRARACIA